jgi:hypothetical protein
MRRALALVTLLVLARTASAADFADPAEYLKVMVDSKLRYNVLTEPSKNPVEELTCPRRTEATRVLKNGDERDMVAWTIKPDALKLLGEGEALFDQSKYADAAEKYKAALAIDPEAVTGYFFLGDALLFGNNDAAGALEQYRKGLALDPTLPSGHLFSSTAYLRLGRPAEAREEIIKALTFHPAYEQIWKNVDQKPELWKIRPVVCHRFDPPAGLLGKPTRNGIDIFIGPKGEWTGYAICKAVWANEPKYGERKKSKEARWSLEEERACVLNQVFGAYNSAASRLEEEQKKRGVAVPNVREDDVLAAMPSLERHIFEVGAAKLLDGYILFEIIGQRCPYAASLWTDYLQKQVEGYLRKYVIVAAG